MKKASHYAGCFEFVDVNKIGKQRMITGVMLAMMVFLKIDYLKSQFIVDFLTVFNGIDAADESTKPFLFDCYANIADMPVDTQARLENYFEKI